MPIQGGYKMVQTNKEYQRKYFENENYTIFDNMEVALDAFAKDTRNIHGIKRKTVF